MLGLGMTRAVDDLARQIAPNRQTKPSWRWPATSQKPCSNSPGRGASR